MRFNHSLRFIFAITFAFVVAGCSEEEGTTAEKKYDPDVQKVREKIHRDGSLTRALDAYYFAIGAYPTTKQGLRALFERPKGLANPENWTGPYLEDEDQIVDTWGNEFKYVYPGKTHEKKYDVISFGPDGEEGTDDDILNWDVR